MIRVITNWIRTARRLVRRATRHLILVRIHTTITQTHSEFPDSPLSPGMNSHNPEYCLACKHLPAYIKKQLQPGKVSQAEFDRLHQLISDYHNSYSRN